MSDLTPPELAKRWRVKPSRIIAWIKSGELTGRDMSNRPGVGRPRYRISEDAIREFEQRREAAARVTKPTRRSRRPPLERKIFSA